MESSWPMVGTPHINTGLHVVHVVHVYMWWCTFRRPEGPAGRGRGAAREREIQVDTIVHSQCALCIHHNWPPEWSQFLQVDRLLLGSVVWCRSATPKPFHHSLTYISRMTETRGWNLRVRKSFFGKKFLPHVIPFPPRGGR